MALTSARSQLASASVRAGEDFNADKERNERHQNGHVICLNSSEFPILGCEPGWLRCELRILIVEIPTDGDCGCPASLSPLPPLC